MLRLVKDMENSEKQPEMFEVKQHLATLSEISEKLSLRHVKQIAVTGRWLYDWFVETCTNLPRSALVTGLAYDWNTDTFRIRIMHPDFPIIPEGEEVPFLEPEVLIPLAAQFEQKFEEGKKFVLDHNESLIAVAQRGYPENCWICGMQFEEGQYFKHNLNGTWEHLHCARVISYDMRKNSDLIDEYEEK